jgi:hypothetical protein
MKELLKGMVGLTVGTSLIPSVMGGLGSLGSGIGGATQSLVGVGFLGHAASLGKKIIKW